MKRALASLIRHALTFGGGAGVLSEDQIGQVAGALAALLGIAWSLADHWLALRAAEMARPAMPAPPKPPAPDA